MVIMSADGKQIINSDIPERFCMVEKPDAVLIVASYRDDRPPVTMARYSDMDEARDAMGALMAALAGGQSCFYMPLSRLFDQERTIHDARTKRKGGS